MTILAVAEQRNGEIKRVSYEATTLARQLADRTSATVDVLLLGGPGTLAQAAGFGGYGADRVIVAEHELLRMYSPDSYSRVVAHAVERYQPRLVLLPATAMGKDLAPRLAARFQAGLATECIAIEPANGSFIYTRPIYAGKLLAKVRVLSELQLASLRPNIVTPRPLEAPRQAATETLSVELAADQIRTRIARMEVPETKQLDVAEARIVISGGRGMQGPENYRILEELAAAAGGTVGASRAAVDAGWRPHADQVGQTGKIISPDLYIACGISGAIQHQVGMKNAKVIVAINKDPEAPIFKLATYGIVGDLFEIVPALTQEFKRVLGR